ncbi:MAG: hypothetical protein ILO34_09120, partial [Kiritimatiellae bacterium]|nr:hypothetical protein [Kiritimatiellia bacterium]
MENKIALSTAAAVALCCAGAFADGLPGRIEYAVNFGRETQAVGRFLPVGSTYWQEGKAWNQEFTAASTTAASGYEDEAAIYRTYIYPNDSTAGLTATYVLPGLEANASYTLRVHVL